MTLRICIALLVSLLSALSPHASATDFQVGGYRPTIGRIKLPGMNDDPRTWCAAGIRVIQGLPGGGDRLDICFLPNDVPLPANSSNGSQHVSYRPIAEFPYYMDMLRHEKPLIMSLDAAVPARHRISKQ